MTFMNEFLGRVHKLVFLADKAAERILRDHGSISFSQFIILNVAHRCERISQKDLARFLGVSEALISRQTRGMEREGLIAKRVNPENRREHALMITAAGKQRFKDAIDLLRKRFRGIEGIVPRAERKQMLGYLGSMVQVFETTGDNR